MIQFKQFFPVIHCSIEHAPLFLSCDVNKNVNLVCPCIYLFPCFTVEGDIFWCVFAVEPYSVYILKTQLQCMSSVCTVNPLTPNIKEQILLSFPHTFLIKYWGEVIKISRKFTLGDHIFIRMTSGVEQALILQGEI